MLKDFVLETCSAPGTVATVNLAGAPSGRNTFASKFSSGVNVYYFMDDGTQWEAGWGVFTSGAPNTINRGTVLANSAGTTVKLNFTGTTRIYNSLPSAAAAWTDPTGNLNLIRATFNGGNWSGAAVLNSSSTNITDKAWAVSALCVNGAAGGGCVLYRTDRTDNNYANFFFGASTNVGSITTTGSATAYNTTSDYRLKVTHGLSRGGLIDLIPVYDAEFKSQPGVCYPMVLAHEVQAVAPFAVVGAKDAVDAEGAIIPQQVDHSKLIPALIAYVQALEKRITELESR